MNLTVDQVLEILKTKKITDSEQVLRRWLREGKIKGEKDGSKWTISDNELETFLKSQSHSQKRGWRSDVMDVSELLWKLPNIRLPWFSRDFVWDLKHQQNFIQSLFDYGMTLQSILFVEEDGTLLLLDGKQRLKTIERFLKNEITLERGVIVNDMDIGNFEFEDLPESIQRTFQDIEINIGIGFGFDYYQLEEQFKRLNS